MSVPAMLGGVFTALSSYLPTFAEDPYLKARKAQVDASLAALRSNACRPHFQLEPRQQALPPPSPSPARATHDPSTHPHPFAYTPLENSSYIRLLRLLAPPTKDELSFALLHFRKVQVQKRYIAVSYCWGRAERNRSIVVNGEKFAVGENLFNLLLELARQHPVGALFWADAICINQGDIRERGQEVQHMQAIYNSASVVNVWLGRLHPDTTILLKLIQRLGTLPEDTIESNRKIENEWDQLILDLENERRLLSAVQILLHNPYWTRVWIVQEFCVNKRLTIHWGHLELDSDSFYTFVQLLRWCATRHKTLREKKGTFRTVTILADIRKDYQAGRSRNLMKLVQDTTFSESSDPRDKVFGLLSLAGDGQYWIPHPDYEASLVDLRVAMTKNYIQREMSLNIILRGPPPSELPSFCPDYFRVGYRRMDSPHNLFPPATGERRQVPSLELIDGPIKMLKVRANIVATIEILGWIYGDGNDTEFPKSTAGITADDVPFQWLIFSVLDHISPRHGKDSFELRDRWLKTIMDPKNPNPTSKKKNAEMMRIRTSNLKVASKQNAMKIAVLTAKQEATGLVDSHIKNLGMLHAHTLGSLFDPSTWTSSTPDQTGSRVEQMKWFEANSCIKLGPRSLADRARECTERSASLLKETTQWEKSSGLDKAYEQATQDVILQWVVASLVRVMQRDMRLCFLKMKERTATVKAGFVHPNAELNDVVALIKGCDAPVVLRADRPAQNGGMAYRVIGEANIAIGTPASWGTVVLV